jgi:hypothetical protein
MDAEQLRCDDERKEEKTEDGKRGDFYLKPERRTHKRCVLGRCP